MAISLILQKRYLTPRRMQLRRFAEGGGSLSSGRRRGSGGGGWLRRWCRWSRAGPESRWAGGGGGGEEEGGGRSNGRIRGSGRRRRRREPPELEKKVAAGAREARVSKGAVAAAVGAPAPETTGSQPRRALTSS